MAQQIINTGSAYNDPDADDMRTAFTKVNDNDTELYTKFPSTPTGDSIRELVNDPKRNQFMYVDVNGEAHLQTIQGWYYNQKAIWGTEYLSHLHSLVETESKFKIIFTGDSTVEGTGVNAANKVNILMEDLIRRHFGLWEVLNTAVGGANTGDWADSMVDADLAQNPDCYIIRFGINNGSPQSLRDEFRSQLRAGLTKCRNHASVANMSIVLMTSNTSNDVPQGRDIDWDEQMNAIVREEAQNFLCCFIDTFAIWPDSEHAATIWMDNPYGNGIAIHPLKNFNWWIVSVIFDTIFPRILRERFGCTSIINTASQINMPLAGASVPTDYNKALSLYRAVTAGPYNWPLDGGVLTFYQIDGTFLQINFDYQTTDLTVRTGDSAGFNTFVKFLNITSTATQNVAGAVAVFGGSGAPNVSQSNVGIGSSSIWMINAAAGLNEKYWDQAVDNGGFGSSLLFRAVNDAASNANIWLKVDRTGFVPTKATLQTSLQIGATGTAVSKVRYVNATLVAGTVAVADTAITANSFIQPFMLTPGGTVGAHFCSVKTAGVGYTISSTNAADTSVLKVAIIDP